MPGNNLTGTLPTELGALYGLTYLYFSPLLLSSLQLLFDFFPLFFFSWVSNNNLYGTLPVELEDTNFGEVYLILFFSFFLFSFSLTSIIFLFFSVAW